jgi:hypothetical protein
MQYVRLHAPRLDFYRVALCTTQGNVVVNLASTMPAARRGLAKVSLGVLPLACCRTEPSQSRNAHTLDCLDSIRLPFDEPVSSFIHCVTDLDASSVVAIKAL